MASLDINKNKGVAETRPLESKLSHVIHAQGSGDDYPIVMKVYTHHNSQFYEWITCSYSHNSCILVVLTYIIKITTLQKKQVLQVLSPGQTDLQVGTSQRKFSKPELVYGLAKGGQKDSQVGSQVAKSHKFHAYHRLMHC